MFIVNLKIRDSRITEAYLKNKQTKKPLVCKMLKKRAAGESLQILTWI